MPSEKEKEVDLKEKGMRRERLIFALINFLLFCILIAAAIMIIVVGYYSFGAYRDMAEQAERKIKRLDRIIRIAGKY